MSSSSKHRLGMNGRGCIRLVVVLIELRSVSGHLVRRGASVSVEKAPPSPFSSSSPPSRGHRLRVLSAHNSAHARRRGS